MKALTTARLSILLVAIAWCLPHEALSKITATRPTQEPAIQEEVDQEERVRSEKVPKSQSIEEEQENLSVEQKRDRELADQYCAMIVYGLWYHTFYGDTQESVGNFIARMYDENAEEADQKVVNALEETLKLFTDTLGLKFSCDIPQLKEQLHEMLQELSCVQTIVQALRIDARSQRKQSEFENVISYFKDVFSEDTALLSFCEKKGGQIMRDLGIELVAFPSSGVGSWVADTVKYYGRNYAIPALKTLGVAAGAAAVIYGGAKYFGSSGSPKVPPEVKPTAATAGTVPPFVIGSGVQQNIPVVGSQAPIPAPQSSWLSSFFGGSTVQPSGAESAVAPSKGAEPKKPATAVFEYPKDLHGTDYRLWSAAYDCVATWVECFARDGADREISLEGGKRMLQGERWADESRAYTEFKEAAAKCAGSDGYVDGVKVLGTTLLLFSSYTSEFDMLCRSYVRTLLDAIATAEGLLSLKNFGKVRAYAQRKEDIDTGSLLLTPEAAQAILWHYMADSAKKNKIIGVAGPAASAREKALTKQLSFVVPTSAEGEELSKKAQEHTEKVANRVWWPLAVYAKAYIDKNAFLANQALGDLETLRKNLSATDDVEYADLITQIMLLLQKSSSKSVLEMLKDIDWIPKEAPLLEKRIQVLAQQFINSGVTCFERGDREGDTKTNCTDRAWREYLDKVGAFAHGGKLLGKTVSNKGFFGSSYTDDYKKLCLEYVKPMLVLTERGLDQSKKKAFDALYAYLSTQHALPGDINSLAGTVQLPGAEVSSVPQPPTKPIPSIKQSRPIGQTIEKTKAQAAKKQATQSTAYALNNVIKKMVEARFSTLEVATKARIQQQVGYFITGLDEQDRVAVSNAISNLAQLAKTLAVPAQERALFQLNSLVTQMSDAERDQSSINFYNAVLKQHEKK